MKQNISLLNDILNREMIEFQVKTDPKLDILWNKTILYICIHAYMFFILMFKEPSTTFSK